VYGRFIENNSKIGGLIVLGGIGLGMWTSNIWSWFAICKKARKLYISRLNKLGESE
ncbi:unnamed protein product, partial [marine sediment metagenome]